MVNATIRDLTVNPGSSRWLPVCGDLQGMVPPVMLLPAKNAPAWKTRVIEWFAREWLTPACR